MNVSLNYWCQIQPTWNIFFKQSALSWSQIHPTWIFFQNALHWSQIHTTWNNVFKMRQAVPNSTHSDYLKVRYTGPKLNTILKKNQSKPFFQSGLLQSYNHNKWHVQVSVIWFSQDETFLPVSQNVHAVCTRTIYEIRYVCVEVLLCWKVAHLFYWIWNLWLIFNFYSVRALRFSYL